MRFNGIIFKKFVFLKYQHPPRLSKLSIFLIFIRLLPPDFQPVCLKIRLLTRTFGGFFYALTISLMNKQPYTKLPRNLDEQVELLEARGLTVNNKNKAKKVLASISYSRLSNYWFPFLKEPKEDEIFQENIEFDEIFKIYQFDAELRVLLFYAIEQIEVAVRSQIIYQVSLTTSTGFWYEDLNLYKSKNKGLSSLKDILSKTKSTNQDFIKKYNNKYSNEFPPAWKSFELLSFRGIQQFYSNLNDEVPHIKKARNEIAKHFGLIHSVFESWLKMLVYIRNICAHHSRIWNITLTIKPVKLKNANGNKWISSWQNPSSQTVNNKIYPALSIILYLLDRVNPYHQFKARLLDLLAPLKPEQLSQMGFPNNWRTEKLWE